VRIGEEKKKKKKEEEEETTGVKHNGLPITMGGYKKKSSNLWWRIDRVYFRLGAKHGTKHEKGLQVK